MKLNYLIIFLSVGVILLGLGSGGAMPADEPEVISGQHDHDENRTPESYQATSIPKGTILLLLAVGVIGALGVSRTKKNNGNGLNRDASDMAQHKPIADNNRQKLIGHEL
jgi:hypothetical protein